MFAVAGPFQDWDWSCWGGGTGQVKLTNQKTHVSNEPGRTGKENQKTVFDLD